MLQAKKIKELDKKYVWHPFTQMSEWEKDDNIIIAGGKDEFLFDIDGKKYIDGVSSLWVNLHGHRNKVINRAIKKQLDRISHSTLLGLGNIPSALLAEKLVSIAPPGLKKVFYSDNGSTAVEAALKIAFSYWQNIGDSKKTKFITLENAYHGDTLGSVSVGGIDLFHSLYRPLLFDTIRIPAPYCYRCKYGKKYPGCSLYCVKVAGKIIRKNRKRAAALIIEPLVQGAAGMLVQPKGYLGSISRICRENNILFIADEVATGFGRTGRMFACNYERITPDIMALAKGLSGGYLPLAATMTTEKIYRAFLAPYAAQKTFFHGHSYTGNQLACSSALASLELFKKNRVIKNLKNKISFLSRELERFKKLDMVGDVRQAGMMAGIELVKDRKTKVEFKGDERIAVRVCRLAREKGLIIRPLGNVIVIMPPLSIKIPNLKKITDIIYNILNSPEFLRSFASV